MANELKTYKTYEDYRIVPPFKGEWFTEEWVIYKILTIPHDLTWKQRWNRARVYFDACINHYDMDNIVAKVEAFSKMDEKEQYNAIREQNKRIKKRQQRDKELWRNIKRY